MSKKGKAELNYANINRFWYYPPKPRLEHTQTTPTLRSTTQSSTVFHPQASPMDAAKAVGTEADLPHEDL